MTKCKSGSNCNNFPEKSDGLLCWDEIAQKGWKKILEQYITDFGINYYCDRSVTVTVTDCLRRSKFLCLNVRFWVDVQSVHFESENHAVVLSQHMVCRLNVHFGQNVTWRNVGGRITKHLLSAAII